MLKSAIKIQISSPDHRIQRGALEVAAPASAAAPAAAAADPSIVVLALSFCIRPPAAASSLLLFLFPQRPPLRRAVDAAVARGLAQGLASVVDVVRVAIEAQDFGGGGTRFACDCGASFSYMTLI